MPRASKFDSAPFIAWDGEGFTTTRGAHRYWLLGNSEGREIEDARGLLTSEALPWLASRLAERPDALHVSFAFGYDTNMLLQGIKRSQLARIHAGERVRVGRCLVQYQPRKKLSVHLVASDGAGGWEERGGQIWDVFGFFQSRFTTALQSYGVLSRELVEQMQRMKDGRATFSRAHMPEIKAYMHSELSALVTLMDRVREYLQDADLKIQRWDGAGAVAAAMLTREQVKPHKARTPDPIQHAARHAYFGGRIECVRYGHTDAPVWQYDVRSAYPAQLARCPSLAGGVWRQDGPGIGDDFAVAHVRWHFTSGAVFPFPWRAMNGRIFFPPEGEGWVWWPELDAARSLLASGAITGSVELLDAWTLDPFDDAKPFGFIPRLYETRARWKREGRGAEKMLKLGLNSLYGKTAQHVGGRRGEPPAWHQLEWAGYVTSRTRAALVAASVPAILSGDLVMFATDAIFTTAPLNLPDGGMGTWEAAQHAGLTVVQSGVYWTGARYAGKEYSRGFDPGSLHREGVINGWHQRKVFVRGSSRRFVGMGRALAARTLAQWGTWPRQVRQLALHPLRSLGGKRHVTAARQDVGELWPTLPTDPHAHRVMQGALSAPVALPWAPDGAARPALPHDPDNVD